MSDGDFGSEDASGGNRTSPYAFAIAFLFFVPGTVLMLLGREHGGLLPKELLELVFPITILPLEKLVLLKFGMGGIVVEDFERIDLFTQQFFVLSFFFFFLVLIFLTGSAAYFDSNRPTEQPSLRSFLLMPLIIFLLREFQINALIANDALLNVLNSRAFVIFGIVRMIAPEGLIFATCMMALCVWWPLRMFFRFVYDRSS